MITVKGVLKNGDNMPIAHARIMFSATLSSNTGQEEIPRRSNFYIETNEAGAYSKEIHYGSYQIAIHHQNQTIHIGHCHVDSQTPNPITILDLVSYQGTSKSLVQQILDDALKARNEAQSFAQAAEKCAHSIMNTPIVVSNVLEMLQVNPCIHSMVDFIHYHKPDNHSNPPGKFSRVYWNDSIEKNRHNGGTIFDPQKINDFPEDWENSAQREKWFTATNSGSGCFIRIDYDHLTPEMFGAKGNGLTDDSESMLAAETTAYSTSFNKIILADKTYRRDKPMILCHTSIIWHGSSMATIDFTHMNPKKYPAALTTLRGKHPSGLAPYKRHDFDGNQKREPGRPVILKNILFEGKNDGSRKYAWDGETNGDLIWLDNANGYNGIKKVENLWISGFKEGFKAGVNTYLLEFNNCIFRHNYLALNLNLEGKKNSGENMRFTGCVFGNNNIVLDNALCGTSFDTCSLDYNFQIVARNQVKIGGVAGLALSFDQCHIESNRHNHKEFPDIPPFINESILRITNSTIHYGGYTDLFYNRDKLFLDNNHFFTPMISATIVKNVGRSAITTCKNWTYKANIYHGWMMDENNSFPTGTPMKSSEKVWNVKNGTGSWETEDTNGEKQNQFVLTNSEKDESAEAESILIPVQGQQLRAAIIVKHTGAGTSFANRIKFWNSAGDLISSQQIDIPAKHKFSSHPTDTIAVPSGCSHYSVFFKVRGKKMGAKMEFKYLHIEFPG